MYFKRLYAPYDDWPAEMRLKAISRIRAMKKDLQIEAPLSTSAFSQWEQQGPYGMPAQYNPFAYYSGRISSIDYHPSAGLFVASASGGLWQSRPVAEFLTWVPLSDQLPTLRTGAVAVCPSNPNTIFLGTGEYNALFQGSGLYRSTDAG